MYMVIDFSGNWPHHGGGLTLAEAFIRVMALAECDYIFHRVEGVMHLTLHHLDDVPDSYRDDPELSARYFPKHQSRLVDDAMARTEIMRKLITAGFKGFQVIKDNYPARLGEKELREFERALP